MSVLTLADAKVFMNENNPAYDAAVQVVIDSAEASIAKRCGPLTSTAVTARVRGGKTTLVLPTTPAISLVSVTPVGATAIDITKLNVTAGGLIEYLTGGAFGIGFFDVSYLAGWSPLPADLLDGVREHVKHLWSSRQGSARKVNGGNPPPVPGAAYAFTYKVNA